MFDRLRRFRERVKGYRTYLFAFLLAVPDILTGLVGVDLSSIVPEGYGIKLSTYIVLLRIIMIPVISHERDVMEHDHHDDDHHEDHGSC